MFRIALLSIVVVSLLCSVGFAGEINFDSANAILETITKKGARYVVREELADWERFNSVMEYIKTGDKHWVKVGILLRPETDAGKTTSLINAVALALPNSPENVLPAIDRGFELEEVCGFPFIEPEMSLLLDHYNGTIRALEKMTIPELAEAKSRCMEELNRQKARIIDD